MSKVSVGVQAGRLRALTASAIDEIIGTFEQLGWPSPPGEMNANVEKVFLAAYTRASTAIRHPDEGAIADFSDATAYRLLAEVLAYVPSELTGEAAVILADAVRVTAGKALIGFLESEISIVDDELLRRIKDDSTRH